jgi:CRP/FNR family cyclic AMP-dependent transcriptional regulator
MVKTEDLKRITLLKEVPDHLLDIIAQEAQLSIFGADTELITVDEEINTFFMLIMGQVAIKQSLTEDIDVILDYIQSGASFGSSALFNGSKSSYTAVCQEPCEVITLSGQRMAVLVETNDELAYYVMSGIARQYKQNMDLRAQMIMKTLDEYPAVKDDINDIENLTLTI